MTRFSHEDPRYRAALREMAKNLSRLLDERNWNQADLVRHAKIHMPEGSRFGPDNASNFVGGRRKPTRPFIKAINAALGVDEADWMPPFLLETTGSSTQSPTPLLTAVPGKPGRWRVLIDMELPLADALRIAASVEKEAGDAS